MTKVLFVEVPMFSCSQKYDLGSEVLADVF